MTTRSSPLVYLEVARAHSALGAALAVWIGGRLAGAEWEGWWLAPMLVAFLLSAAGNAFNDAHDAPLDRLNRPTRPIPRGALTARAARGFAYGCAGLALLLALPFGPISITGTVVGVALLFLYTTHLKGLPVLGNLVVGTLTAMALGYGGVLAGNIPAVILPAAALAMLFSGREVLKTIHDIGGDQRHLLRTIATEAGPRAALALATGMFGIALAFLVVWIMEEPARWPVLVLTAAASLIVLLPLWKAPGDHHRVTRALQWSKAIGLFLLAAFSLY